VAAITGILIGCLLILSPFLPAILLAAIFALSAWPAYVWLERNTGHRPNVAAGIMTLLLAVGFIVPLSFLGSSLADSFTRLLMALTGALQNPDRAPPSWLQDLPLISPYIDDFWRANFSDPTQLAATLREYAAPISQRLLKIGGTIARGVLDLSLGVLIAFFFFRYGTQVAGRLSNLITKFFGMRGQHLLSISKRTMIGVVYGILGTAVAQGVLATIGFAIAGMPGAPFLGIMTLLLSFVPMGPPIIWVPATIWLFTQGHVGMAIFLGIWGTLVISGVDNVIRPYFISLGSNLPILLVLMGVLGGIAAFGFIGLFIGPTLLALAYTLIIDWSHRDPHAHTPEDVEAAL